MQRKLLGMISVDLDATGQLMIFCISQIHEKKNVLMQCVSYV